MWWLNGCNSPADQKQVAEAYTNNTPLLTALKRNNQRKANLTGAGVEVFARYRPDLTVGVPWILGHGRFLVITVLKDSRRINCTVFELADGTRLVVMPAPTRKEADALAAAAGPGSNVFAVRPSFSFPVKEWIAADSQFWRRASR